MYWLDHAEERKRVALAGRRRLPRPLRGQSALTILPSTQHIAWVWAPGGGLWALQSSGNLVAQRVPTLAAPDDQWAGLHANLDGSALLLRSTQGTLKFYERSGWQSLPPVPQSLIEECERAQRPLAVAVRGDGQVAVTDGELHLATLRPTARTFSLLPLLPSPESKGILTHICSVEGGQLFGVTTDGIRQIDPTSGIVRALESPSTQGPVPLRSSPPSPTS